MKTTNTVIFGLLFLLCNYSASFADDSNIPPAFYIDKGACPFECCTYREWKTEKAIIIRERPDKKSKIIATIKPKNKDGPTSESVGGQ